MLSNDVISEYPVPGIGIRSVWWLNGGGGLVAKSCPTLASPWTVACQAPLSMEFSRQEYWSGLPFPSPGDLPRNWTPVSYIACRWFTNWAMMIKHTNHSIFLSPLYHAACVLSHFSHVWLWNPMDCSPPGSSGHGMLQARILENIEVGWHAQGLHLYLLCLLHWQVSLDH